MEGGLKLTAIAPHKRLFEGLFDSYTLMRTGIHCRQTKPVALQTQAILAVPMKPLRGSSDGLGLTIGETSVALAAEMRLHYSPLHIIQVSSEVPSRISPANALRDLQLNS